tara:strand:- start:156 stop:512 length:357 start_codon:yes stop_codon:yes gene_type:complete
MNREVKLKLWHVLISVVSLTLLLYFLFVKITPTTTGDYTEQKQKIDSLKNVITGLEDKQIELDRSIVYQQNEIVILNKQIDSTNIEILNVRRYYAKKIKDITTYTPTQLDDFFSKRYQ